MTSPTAKHPQFTIRSATYGYTYLDEADYAAYLPKKDNTAIKFFQKQIRRPVGVED